MVQISIPKELADHARRLAKRHMEENESLKEYLAPMLPHYIHGVIENALVSSWVAGWLDWAMVAKSPATLEKPG
jgi:hypothetical protein